RDPREHVLQLEPGHAHHLQKLRGVETVVTIAVRRELPGRCRIGDYGSPSCFYGSEPTRCRAEGPCEWVVTAGVQNDETEPYPRVFHAVQRVLDFDRVVAQIVLDGEWRINGDKVVGAARLHPVAGIVNQADAPRRKLLPESA